MSSRPVDTVLEPERRRLARIDAELVRLYLERRRGVERLMELKRSNGLPRFDAVQEARVLARARATARALGGSAEDAERLVRWILDEVHRSDTEPPTVRVALPG